MKITMALLFSGVTLCAIAQNIGINTPTPNAALDVRSTGSTSATYGVLVSNTTNDTSLVVSDNGNVGIGTTLPAYTLDVQSSNPIAARFSGRVTGQNAVNGNEFITLQQAGTLGGSGSQATPTMWSAESPTSVNYTRALLYCRTLTQGGHTDWRIPTDVELELMLENDAIPYPPFQSGRFYWLKGDAGGSAKNHYYMDGTFPTPSSSAGFGETGNTTTSTSFFAVCVR